MTSRTGLLVLPLAACAVLLAFVFWRWLGAPVALPDAPAGGLQCLSYTPFEPGDLGATAPGWVSDARIAEDLRRLRALTGCLRVYTPLGNTPRVLAAARPAGFRILLGAWIGSDLDQNEREIAAALTLARRYPDTVAAIVVGNEVLLRRELSPGRLAALIRDVREHSPVPVAYADVAHYIEQSPQVADAADLLLIHLLPYWDDPRPPPVGAAVEQVIASYADFRRRFPGKAVMIGETGWPSRGRSRGPGRPGLVSEARFVRGFAARAAALGIRYNLIEALDEPWKRAAEGTVGGYWGLLDQWREPKFPLAGPVSARPAWREEFIATALIAVATLGAGLSRPRGVRAWFALAGLAIALGVVLVFQFDYAVATSRSYLAWLGSAVAATLAVASVVLLDGVARGVAQPVTANLAELARALGSPPSLAAPRLRRAVFTAAVMLPGAWFALTLAFDPRHRDVPLAWFTLPALAIAVTGDSRESGDCRQEAVLALLLIICGLWQLEVMDPGSLAWLGICALLAWPWRRAAMHAALGPPRSHSPGGRWQ